MPEDAHDSTFGRITPDEISSFIDKLVASGAGLAPAERSLLEVLVERARSVTPEDVRMAQLRTGLSDAVRSVLEAQARAWGIDAPEGWVRIDPIWIRSGAGDLRIAGRIATSR